MQFRLSTFPIASRHISLHLLVEKPPFLSCFLPFPLSCHSAGINGLAGHFTRRLSKHTYSEDSYSHVQTNSRFQCFTYHKERTSHPTVRSVVLHKDLLSAAFLLGAIGCIQMAFFIEMFCSDEGP